MCRSPFLTFASPFSILNCLSERRFFIGVPKKTCPSKKRFHTSRHVRLSKPNNLPRRPLTHSTYSMCSFQYYRNWTVKLRLAGEDFFQNKENNCTMSRIVCRHLISLSIARRRGPARRRRRARGHLVIMMWTWRICQWTERRTQLCLCLFSSRTRTRVLPKFVYDPLDIIHIFYKATFQESILSFVCIIMWNQVVLAILLVSVPAQYLISKYWTTKGSTYYLQKTFSSLDEKLQLREWLDTTWPDRWLDCARKFIFDYRGFAQEREERDDRRRPNLGDEDWDQMLESLETSDEGTGLGSNSNNAQGKSVVKKNEDAYDPSIHFGTSKEPRSPRHPEAVFHVGQVVMNKKRGYRGVVIGWDSRPIVPKNLQRHMFPKGQPNLLEQPWYAILIDTRDRLLPQMDYVPQKDIEMLFNSVIVHPVIHEYFEIRPLVNGLYRMRPFLKSVYPED